MELNKDDVVSLAPDMSFKAGGTVKVDHLYAAVTSHVGAPYSNWFKETGVVCEVLKTEGGGWQKGKIRFRVEFIPDEPEVPQQNLMH